MPSTKKKISKKSTTTTKKRKPTSVVKKNKVEEKVITPRIEFINIYEHDPVIKSKSRLAWLVVGIIMIAIVAFWFWSLKTTMIKNQSNDDDLNNISTEIDNIVKEFKEMVGNTKNVIDSNNQTEREKEIARIKNDVLAQIQINSDSANWPEHSSKILGLSLKYPTHWFKKEEKNLITLSSYDLKSTTTPEISTKITISKIDANIAIDDLFEANYQKTAEEIFIDLIPAEKYNDKNSGENSLSYLLLVESTKNIYKINIYSNNKNIFEATINKILSTIDLL